MCGWVFISLPSLSFFFSPFCIYCLLHCRCAAHITDSLFLSLQVWSGVGYRLDDIADLSQSNILTALLPWQPLLRTPAELRPFYALTSHSLLCTCTHSCLWLFCITCTLPSPLSLSSPLFFPFLSSSFPIPFCPLIFPSVLEEPHLENFDLRPRRWAGWVV